MSDIDNYKKLLDIKNIYDYTKNCDLSDVYPTIERQIDYNYTIALEGIKNNYGSNIGKLLLENNPDDEDTKLKAYAAAGSDARMNGCDMPVVINSGSGNQGITVSVPIIQYAKDNNISKEQTIRALVLANLIAIHEKTPIGTLSAFCGAVCAGAASGAGIAFLNGASLEEVSQTVSNALGIASGIICDGAKASCASKIALSVEAGLLGNKMYKTKNSFLYGDGIIEKNIEETINSVGKIAKEGMQKTNDTIIDIMINNK